jgi:pyridoxal 5'-phosphate synthase pdxS subunit
VVNAVEHCRSIFGSIRQLSSMLPEEIYNFAKVHMVPLDLVKQGNNQSYFTTFIKVFYLKYVFLVRELKRLPVVTFAAGGIATPADVILMMQMGCDGVFVGSGIFKVIIKFNFINFCKN